MTISFIWDLDGTLIDSYGAILNSLAYAYDYYGWDFDREQIERYIKEKSVGQLVADKKAQTGIDFKPIYSQNLESRNHEIVILDGALDALEWAKDQGFRQFIYTHKGDNAFPLLKDLGMDAYFTEILTAAKGFKRKPHPEGVDYLVDKYQLDRAKTYYIGDRPLDVDVALNAGIRSINFIDYQPDYNQQIHHLRELASCFKDQ